MRPAAGCSSRSERRSRSCSRETDRAEQDDRGEDHRERAGNEAEVREPRRPRDRASAAIAMADSAHAMTRSASCAISRSKNVSPSANTSASADANRQPHPERARHVGHRLVRYRRGVASLGPSTATTDPPPAASISIPVQRSRSRSRSRCFAIAVWFIRSIPRTLSALAIATLFALALNPLVEALKRRTGWHRRTAAGVVLVTAVHRRRARHRADHRTDDPRGPRLQQADPADGEGPRHAARSSVRGCGRPRRRRRCSSG